MRALAASRQKLTLRRILEANKVFTALHRILELRGREDLTRGILACLDYTRYVLLSPVRT